jgi:hypothetical protein
MAERNPCVVDLLASLGWWPPLVPKTKKMHSPRSTEVLTVIWKARSAGELRIVRHLDMAFLDALPPSACQSSIWNRTARSISLS